MFARGPNRGKANVYLDGRWRATVDLYAAKERPRWVASSARLDPSTPHEIEVRVLGTKRSTSGGTRVDLDAVALLSA